MPKIRYSNKAVEDLTSIWDYTYTEWSEKQADEYYAMLIASCNRLLYPSIVSCKCYAEIADDLFGIKAGHHLIFYKRLDNDDVFVIRILHERMDIKRHIPTQIKG